MTACGEREDLVSSETFGVLCRCGHLLTDSDIYFCGYCGCALQLTTARRKAPAAAVSGRRAALAALASGRDDAAPGPVPEPVTDRFPAPMDAVSASPAPEPEPPSDPEVVAPEADPAAAATPPARPARTARAARAARANRRSRPPRGARVAAAAVVEPSEAPPDEPSDSPATAARADRTTESPEVGPPSVAVAAAAPVAGPAALAPPEEEVPAPRPDASSPESPAEASEPEAAPRAAVSRRRTWPAWLVVVVVVAASAVRTALGLVFTFPAWLAFFPVVLVAALAFTRARRFSIGLVGVAAAATTLWWVVDHVVSTARLQALGYDVGYVTIPVPVPLAAVGSVPLAVVLCVLVDRHVRATVRDWVVGRGALDTLRAAAVVLALLAAVFPVARSISAEPGFARLTAARDQVLVPGYPTPGQIADQMHATSVAKGRPVSVTCTYAPPEVEPRPSYRCIAVSTAGGEAAQVHDGILSAGRPDGSYTCVDLTRGVDRRLC